ncbi:MAG: ABC transporter substrate-binding protein [Buchananella hordeovulneris]|nr:ABC transporter substrate-binding protein [Buchananella hordeovulneris]
MRRLPALIATLTAAAALLGGCASGESAAPTPAPAQSTELAPEVTVGLTYVPNVQFTPAYYAEAKNFFAERGVAGKLRHHGAQEDLFGALAAGEEQIVVAGATEAVVAAAAGQDVVLLAPYYRAYPAVLIVPADSPIQTVADLSGRSVGIPGEYGENLYALEGALAGAGLTRQDVKVESIGYTQVAALAAGHVDAVIGFVNNEPVQAAAQGVAVRTVPLGQTDLLGAALVTSRAALAKNPEGIAAAAKAMQDGIDATIASVVNGADEAIEVAKQFVPDLTGEAETGARATLDATLQVWDGTMLVQAGGETGSESDFIMVGEYLTLDRVEAMIQSLQRAGVLAGPVEADKLLP